MSSVSVALLKMGILHVSLGPPWSVGYDEHIHKILCANIYSTV